MNEDYRTPYRRDKKKGEGVKHNIKVRRTKE